MLLRSVCLVTKTIRSSQISNSFWYSRFISASSRHFSFTSKGFNDFKSRLGNSNVSNPFEDPSRRRKEVLLKPETRNSLTEKPPRILKTEKLANFKDKEAANTYKDVSKSGIESLTENVTKQGNSRLHFKKLEDEAVASRMSAPFSEPDANVSFTKGESVVVKDDRLTQFSKKIGFWIDPKLPREEIKRRRLTRNTTIGGYILAGSSIIGRAKRDSEGNIIPDEFSGSFLGPFYRIANSFKLWRDYVVEPSREVLLPDPLPPPYLQPKYTLVIEMKHVLVAPEWTYKTGHRFKKRPALDYFLDIVGYPNFEVVIYTAESSMNGPQIVESIDPKQRIMYKLYRDCTKYMNGHHVKDLSRLNRDLSKVIFIDYDPKSFQLNPENVLRIPKWDGDMDDTSLFDLAELLKVIHLSDVDDVRPTLQYYSQFDDPPKEFRKRAMYIAEKEQEAKSHQDANTSLKKYSGRLFGYGRHRYP